jgi:hypothetical protein
VNKDHFEDVLSPTGYYRVDDKKMEVFGTRVQCAAFLAELDKCAKKVKQSGSVAYEKLLGANHMENLTKVTKVVWRKKKGKRQLVSWAVFSLVLAATIGH